MLSAAAGARGWVRSMKLAGSSGWSSLAWAGDKPQHYIVSPHYWL